ncbi:hypothetical protein BN948_05066 [Hydrogenophaga intermedia]|uniref:Uncharacterized protein n=1 Tax=Hydrogenophaga intermedia TaxID=65786 RepID=A0A1L1Q1C9_HYDIT|nr:hypothetical protein [Hydrogenophaga intermedia]CDN90621.1 hypothetical protein BN948_05066 [Hydrogenophaga intermedia]
MTKVFKKQARHLMQDDLVDLRSCPSLRAEPIAQNMYGHVTHVRHESTALVVVGYEGIDHVGYARDQVITVIAPQIYLFPHKLTVIEAEETPVIGFVDESSGVAIEDPSRSTCSRFEVEPQAYGLTPDDVQALKQLNEAVRQSCEDALDAMSLAIQNHLQVHHGDFAGMYFSGECERRGVLVAALRYAVAQIEDAKRDLVDDEAEGDAR